MKTDSFISKTRWVLLLLLVLGIAALTLTACAGGDVPAESDTEASAAPTDPVTDVPTEPETETDAPETVPETEPVTEPPLWHPDTGVFNEGHIAYEPTYDDDGQIVSVRATSVDGTDLGLDITDKKDLVGICYSVWFDAILGHADGKVDHWYNVEEALAGTSGWGPANAFHYWSKPAQGYYRSSDKQVIRDHMNQLYAAGVDFIIVDLTNAGDGYLSGNRQNWLNYIQYPMDAICETIMAMRAEGLGTPYVVFWAGVSAGPLYQELFDRYILSDWADCFVYWDGKPFLLTTHIFPQDFPLPDLFTVRRMWGLNGASTYGWSYLNPDSKVTSIGPDGEPEQVGVCVASQRSYISASDAVGRRHGITFYAQWFYAFMEHPKVVTVCWWNEWTAQRIPDGKGGYNFTDEYTQEYSRDIEPMEGGHGDDYYRWLTGYIAAYKAGLDCPVLVEEGFEETAVTSCKRQFKIH
ncbi:MAG: hypothetical protein MJ192_01150 [Clostridia bacterium]|nr:hypothetical protein [Clostridia bacterium]